MVILSRYTRNCKWHQVLDEFVSGGLYELTVDDGHSLTALDGLVSTVSCRGTTLVMNIVLLQIIEDQEDLRCPTCGGPMPVSQGNDREVWW
jgi:hypothetical protein